MITIQDLNSNKHCARVILITLSRLLLWLKDCRLPNVVPGLLLSASVIDSLTHVKVYILQPFRLWVHTHTSKYTSHCWSISTL